MRTPQILVFTDGASKRNPGPGGWGVIVVTPDGHVTELGGGSGHTTNNRMELAGAIAALSHLRAVPGRVAIYTDSTYIIQGIREWVPNWRRRGWKIASGGDVLNREQWEELADLVDARGPRSIEWHYVRGHSGIPGNERVDQIADAFALQRPVELYDGLLLGYDVPIHDLPDDTRVPARRSSSNGAPGSSRTAFSYLSVVDGVARRHATWAECEQRVKGRSGARFKKAANAADEAAILRSWNVSLD